MHLKLWKTYYDRGFFNVTVDYDKSVRSDNGEITLVLGRLTTISGRVDRGANLNGTARVHGGAALRNWFQANYRQGSVVPVKFGSPYHLTLG